MKTFATILNTAPNIKNILYNHQYYWAHIHLSKAEEPLWEHIAAVNQYFLSLIHAHGLEARIDKMISDCTIEWSQNKEAADFLKLLFTQSIVFHDFGKINENFQVLRMRNTARFKQNYKLPVSPLHGHSFLGTIIFLVHHIDIIVRENCFSDDTKRKLIASCVLFGYPILQHHSPILTHAISEVYLQKLDESLSKFKKYIQLYGFAPDEGMIASIFTHIKQICDPEVKGKSEASQFPFFALIKLNFSLLTAADYLATHEYMNSSDGGTEAKTTDMGVFDDRIRVAEIIAHLRNYKHNKDTFANVDGYVFIHPQERSNENLNRLRQEMAVELIQTIRKNLGKRLFYIEAPTGGGKTNLSIITCAELLQAHSEINKIIYVFPFTTLITQTYKVLKATMGLKDNEIVELHSKAAFSRKQDEQNEDGLFGDEKKDFIDNLFALYPVTLMSHVKFFDILKTNSKESNYLLHRIANSVVIIDEIQSYNPSIWDKMLYFISQYATYFNVRFVLMSATLPKISDLDIGLSQKPEFTDLLPNARRYVINKNFSERVVFNFELFDRDILIEELRDAVISKSNKYALATGSVKTIVEFIYKNSATDFYHAIQTINNQEHVFDQIFVLSGTVLEPRRREIINFIKQAANKKSNILLITTQVVEAGVDIDMDLGFKNRSLLDSDEQLAGRVNRNASKANCEVYLFDMDNPMKLYGSDKRFKQTRESIGTDDYKQILREKDFKRLYEKVMKDIDKVNSPEFKDSIIGYKSLVNELYFDDVDKYFKIIDQNSTVVFVPLKVPIKVGGDEAGRADEVFSGNDLAFLRNFDVLPFDGQINGSDVWGVYEQLIYAQAKQKGIDLKRKVDLKVLQSIMSKFTFSLMTFSKQHKNILEGFGEEKFGYLYFHYWETERTEGVPYSYENGLNSKAFSDSNFI